MRNQWLVAACLSVLAGLMRIEGWLLIAVVPLVQLGRERRVSPLACAILPLGPLIWLYISWKAGGSPWSYFAIRNNYIQQSLLDSPALAHFTLQRMGFDLARLLYGVNPITLLAGLSLIATVKRRAFLSLNRWRMSASTVLFSFFFAHLLFLLTAYFSGNQPDVWPRYGLILFALLLPLMCKLSCKLRQRIGLAATERCPSFSEGQCDSFCEWPSCCSACTSADSFLRWWLVVRMIPSNRRTIPAREV